MAEDLRIDDERVIAGHCLSMTTARASGPGGQHVNRTESKVQLTLDIHQVHWLRDDQRRRLLALAGRMADAKGHITVSCQEHREQSRNLELARNRLAELVQKALIRPRRRIATKPTKGSVRRRLEEKRRVGLKKAARTRAGGED